MSFGCEAIGLDAVYVLSTLLGLAARDVTLFCSSMPSPSA